MRKFFLHFLFWVVFFLMWNRIMYFYVSNVINRLYFSAWDVSLIMLAFYIIYVYIMPDYFRRKNITRLIMFSMLLIILLSGAYAWIMGVFLHHYVMPIHFDFLWTYADLQYNRFFVALPGVLGGCFVKLALDRIEVRRKMEMMEKEKSQAELIYLKAQINPHFLFNSLNSLYTQLELNLEEAKGTLISLAELLRYQLYECDADFISMAKEVTYLESYFNLQSIRNDNCTADFLINGNYEGLVIAPLLLIPFVENAFKHVSDNDVRRNFIKIRLDFVDGHLHFFCGNSVDVKSNIQSGNPSKGIGLINVKKRLDLVYRHRFNLKEEINNGEYHITLTLNLK
ncbi:sensor histidine kinase [Mucilaginibacter lappiensis]|uniref:Sensor histidine kinase YesM n=1 Tax=Mucilaginibacter lappiensis TaxID=354630 RepID=A0A841JJP0_9SPHI|nr:sensor histidine kinase [Mucilaginibacter lappiensis]MBB6131157.1 sensor histidine kinase YesM [Mucilaginibacter lappiensis]